MVFYLLHFLSETYTEIVSNCHGKFSWDPFLLYGIFHTYIWLISMVNVHSSSTVLK